MIFHKIHICNLYSLHEVYRHGSATANYILEKFQHASHLKPLRPLSEVMRMRTWFSTIIASEIFLTFMNGFDVHSQVMRMRKWFSVGVTFEIFLIFMNGFHIYSQITSLSIWFSTIFTCEIFVILLNCFDMNPERRSPVNDFSQ